jgi:hypothetical protein
VISSNINSNRRADVNTTMWSAAIHANPESAMDCAAPFVSTQRSDQPKAVQVPELPNFTRDASGFSTLFGPPPPPPAMPAPSAPAPRPATPSWDRRAAEAGGLAGALQSSRGGIEDLARRRERMEERFCLHERECQHLRDLTCARGGGGRPAVEAEREREALGLSERISACIELAGKVVAELSEQQEEAELSLLRANAAILNRVNAPKPADGQGGGEKRSPVPLPQAGPGYRRGGTRRRRLV